MTAHDETLPKEARQRREHIHMDDKITIELYSDAFRDDFIRLNRQWIERYFKIEPSDEKVFEDPRAAIIDTGGQIFIAVRGGKAIGCCALIFHAGDGSYELAKMAVDPASQGKGAGHALARALIAYAKSHGAKSLFLEANTKLTASVRLYGSLGFKPVEAYKAAYERCDLYMRMTL